MPRAGLAIEQQGKGGGLNFGNGNGEITNAVVICHQFPASKKTNEQEDVSCKMRLTLTRLDKDFKPTGEDDIDEYIKIGPISRFHPGNAAANDDDDPEDLGDELDTEGNCIYVEDGAQINQRSKAAIFSASLQAAGFKPEYLNGYMPNLIGTQAKFVTKKMKGEGSIGDWEVLTIESVHKFPYQKGGAATKGADNSKATSAGKAAGKAAPVSTAKAESNGRGASDPDETVVAYASDILMAIGEAKAGQTLTRASEGAPAQRMKSQIVKFLTEKKVPPANHMAVKGLLEGDWFVEQAEELGWEVDGNKVVVP